jgi:hypothetical protein
MECAHVRLLLECFLIWLELALIALKFTTPAFSAKSVVELLCVIHAKKGITLLELLACLAAQIARHALAQQQHVLLALQDKLLVAVYALA